MTSSKARIRGIEKMLAARRYAEAERAARGLVNAGDSDARLLNLLATALQRQGKFEQSENWFAQSLIRVPDQFGVLLDQARNKVKLGKRVEANQLAQRAAGISAGNFEECMQIAEICREIGNIPSAIAFLRRATELRPGDADALAWLGTCMRLAGNRLGAVEPLRRAVELNPGHVHANLELGELLLPLDDHAGALRCFEAVLRAEPENPSAHLGLAKAHHALGDSDRAIDDVHRVIRLAPEQSAPFVLLGKIKRFSPGDPDIALMRQRLHDGGEQLGPGQRGDITLALAKATEDCGEPAEACDLYLEAKSWLRRSQPYSIEAAKRFCNRLRQVFDAETIAGVRERGLDGYAPIFIVGLPRCGKTSIAHLLGRHPGTVIEPEEIGLGRVINSLIPAGNVPFDAAQVRATLLRTAGSTGSQPPPAGEPGATRPPIKVSSSPANLWALGAIDMMFSDARIIHCVREPVAHCISMFKYKFNTDWWGFSNSIEDTIAFMRLYEDLIGYWKSVISTPIHEVRYDDLVRSGDAGTAALFEACGLDAARIPGPLPRLDLGSDWSDGIAEHRDGSPEPDEAAAPVSGRELRDAFLARVPALQAWAQSRRA